MFRNFGEQCAVIDERGREFSYNQIFEDVEAFYSQIGRRCLIFIMCKNEKDSLVGYVSCINHHVVPLLLSAGLDEELYAHLKETYHPEYIWAPSGSAYAGEMECVWTLDEYSLYRTGLEPYALNEKLALLLTTSGSTGSPKLVRQSYDNIRANTESIVEYLEITAKERPITSLPMNYTYGLSIINTHLYTGATILMTNHAIMQKEFWQIMREREATSIAGVPYTYEMLNRLRFFGMDLPALKTMTQAGGKLSPELHRKFAEYAAEKEKKFIVMYGQAEATARMAYLPAEHSLEKYGSMGIAIPGGRLELIDVNGNLIEDADIVGELVYYGENVTLGYAEKGEDLAHGDERNGCLVTGDMAKRDEDGFYYIVGRKKRFLKIFGNRVNLDETERMLKTRFPEVDVACAGVDDKMYVFVTADMDETEIRKYLSEKTGLHISAFCVKKIEEVPKNDSGKTLYKALEKYYKE